MKTRVLLLLLVVVSPGCFLFHPDPADLDYSFSWQLSRGFDPLSHRYLRERPDLKKLYIISLKGSYLYDAVEFHIASMGQQLEWHQLVSRRPLKSARWIAFIEDELITRFGPEVIISTRVVPNCWVPPRVRYLYYNAKLRKGFQLEPRASFSEQIEEFKKRMRTRG